MSKPVALVTGASRGIGESIVETLDQMGYRCALVSRTKSDLDRLKGKLGGEHAVFPANLKDLDSLEPLIERIVETMGRLDVLVNNAGMGGFGAVNEADVKDWHDTLHVNTLALMYLTRFASPHLLKSDRPAIVNTASVAGQMVMKGGGSYCASKHAALAFSHATFEDLRDHGVKVSAICPGFVNTDMPDGDNVDRQLMIQPADIAYTVKFILEFPATGCPTEITIRPQRNPYKS